MKQFLGSLVILNMLILAGCGSTGAASDVSEGGNLPAPEVEVESGAVPPADNYVTLEIPLGDQQPAMGNSDPFQSSPQAQLFIGLLGLEKTSLALNSTQAISFLPALTSLQDEISEGTITQARIEEMDAYFRSVLSLEQVNALAEMDLSQENMKAILDPYGIRIEPRGAGNGNSNPQGTPPAGTGGGEPGAVPQGTPPADPGTGGGLGPGGGNGNPQSGLRAGNGFYPEGLLEALIALWQTRAAE